MANEEIYFEFVIPSEVLKIQKKLLMHE